MPTLPKLEYHLINAFTTTSPHSGNQAAVVLFPTSNDPRAEDDKFLLTTAQDFGFSETAYLVPIDAESGRWGLRWFTVDVEVPICGHATLAASKVLLSRYPQLSEIKFETRFWGKLTATRRQGGFEDENNLEVTISLSTLSKPALEKLVQTSAQHLEEVGPVVSDILKISKDQVVGVGEFEYLHKSLIVELSPGVDLKALEVEAKALSSVSPGMTIVTQMQPQDSSTRTLRINSRVFCSGDIGDMEDPVTGSAHAFLTGYYLLTPASDRIPPTVRGDDVMKVALDARQLSERGGKLYCELREGGMVDISGTAADWGTGTLTSW